MTTSFEGPAAAAYVFGVHKCDHCGGTGFEVDWNNGDALCYDCGFPYSGFVVINLETLGDGGVTFLRHQGLSNEKLWWFLGALVAYVPAVWLIALSASLHELVLGLIIAMVSGLMLATIVRDLQPARYELVTSRSGDHDRGVFRVER